MNEYIEGKNKAMLVDYVYADEQNEQGSRTSYVVVVYTNTTLGKEIDKYLGDDEPDFIHLDQSLIENFDIKDTDVCYCIVDPYETDDNEEGIIRQVLDENDMVIREVNDIVYSELEQ